MLCFESHFKFLKLEQFLVAKESDQKSNPYFAGWSSGKIHIFHTQQKLFQNFISYAKSGLKMLTAVTKYFQYFPN